MADAAPATAWRWNDYLLLPAQRRLLRHGVPVELEDRTLDLIVLLVQHRDRALDRHEITSAIWGKRPVADTTLRQLVYKARRAVGDDGAHQTTIHTLYGRSLQWIAPVERVFEPELPDASATLDASADARAQPASSGRATPEASPAEPVATGRPGSNGTGTPVLALPSSVTVAAMPTRGLARGRWPVARRVYLVAGGLIVMLAIFAAVLTLGIGWKPRRRTAAHRSTTTRTAAITTAPGPVTIAVLPFLRIGPKQNQSYLSDGLTEELINRLGRFPKLRVAARTSSFVFRDKPVDIRAAAHALGVAYVLEGSVQSSGDRLRVRVQLVSAKDGYELWSDEYDPTAGDVLKVEDEIATAVLGKLDPELNAHELAVLDAMPARARVDPAAHDAYLVGRQYLSRRDTPDIKRGIAYFEQAIQIEPAYADAWSSLAAGYAMLRDYNPDARPDTHYRDALAAVNKALMLDPQSPSAHAVRGMLYMRHWQWQQAAGEFQRALQLDPNDATAHQWYGIYFWFIGDMPGALAQMRTAHELDPLSPIINADLSRALLYAGNVAGAIAQGRAAVTLAPRFELAHLFLASALASKGRYADAIREIRAGIAVAPASPASDDLAFLGYMEWQQGDHQDARRLLEVVEARARQHYVSGVALASLEWPVGEKDQAMANLDRAAADHDSLLMTVSGVRDDDWCSDPRFQKLLASMNLPLH